MTSNRRLTIGILNGYQVYGNKSDSQTIEGNSITDYLLRMHQGILRAARAADCNILIGCGLGSPPMPEHPFPAWFNCSDDATFVPVGPWNTDGLVVLTPVISEPRQQLLRELRAGGFPIVFCGMGEPPAVVADDAHGIREAVLHLYAHGHRHIAYIAGYERNEGDSGTRQTAYQATLRELGLNELIVYGYHTIQGGKNAMRQLLALSQTFSAVITSDYHSAIGASWVLREAGLSVPQDVALIGFDDYLEAQAQSPPVTTIHMQWAEMGYQSVELLLDYIQKRRSEPVTLTVRGQLVLRGSCGCTPENIRTTVEPVLLADTEIVQRLTETALRGTYHVRFIEAETWFAELLHAFRASLRDKNKGLFLTALAGVLRSIAELDDDVSVLQDVLTVLRQNAALDAGDHADALLAEAELRISDEARAQAAQHMVRKLNTSAELGAMTSRLLVTLDEAEIPGILVEHLPRLGIARAEIAALERDEDDPAAWSLLWGLERAERRFPTRQFPPDGLYPAERAFHSILLPLLPHHEQVGYIAFATDDLEPLATIAQHVSAAIASARLYKEAQEGRQLAETANKLKTRFLSTVSHELRTPINLIVGLSELMLREHKQGKTPTGQDLERIYASSRHLGFLIRDVLDLASSDARQLRLSLEPLNLNDVLRTVATTGEQLTTEKGLTWTASFSEPGVRILGDRLRLQQILLNLISNAVKFTVKGGVTLTVEETELQVRVSVSDTGLGIPPAEQESIFDEFHQSDRTAARGFGGIGLGLAISRHLVQLHGGEIGVRSTGVESEGATLFFTLPVMKPASHPLASSLRFEVLVLTDRLQQSAALCEHLANQGYTATVLTFDDERSWLTQVAANPPAAILLDQDMVVSHGWHTIESLRRNSMLQNIPMLFYDLDDSRETGSVFEFDYHTKPLPLDSLSNILAARVPQTILLVDDDQNVLDLHTRLIQAQLPECRVIHAHHGRDALEILSTLHPDLILLDLMMPELDGFGVLKALQTDETMRRIPVVVLTSKVLDERDMEKLDHGIATVLEKGIFTNEETLARITTVLNRNNRAVGASQQIVRRAMAYIHTHYAESLNRDVLAAHLAVSENYLTNCFQKEIGVSPLTYLNRYRILQARDLLSETKMTVTEIALAVGFSDLAHFSRVFRKETGYSPLEYRREFAASQSG